MIHRRKPGPAHSRWPLVDRPEGQTLVIFALMIVALIAMVGIAVDVGFGFVRSSQFSAAVDAAALAGVIDLDLESENDTTEADVRAWQFLGANGWPTRTITSFASGRSYTQLGIPEYSITVTWPVETFFMRIFGLEGFPVTRAATAAFFAQAELYTTTAFERGHARKASQFVFGPEGCTFAGDPVSPRFSTDGVPNEGYPLADGVYRYRIRVPQDYNTQFNTNKVRIELFDPDSVNALIGTEHEATHSATYSVTTGIGTSPISCLPGAGTICVERTGESLDSVSHNPFWFVRVDETWNNNCQQDMGSGAGNTHTSFELYYFDAQSQRVPLALYLERNAYVEHTDLRWVSPGPVGPVPADFGSFEVDISPIPVGLGNNRFIYLEVATYEGSSRNVWDILAGRPLDRLPPEWLVSNHINDRNLYLANNPTFDPTGGIQTFALGRMPLQNFYGNAPLNLPLAPIDTLLADGVIYATVFDYDYSPAPEIVFTIDVVSPFEFRRVGLITDDTNNLPPGGIASLCNGSTVCNNEWIRPQFRMGVPTYLYMNGILFGEYYPHRNAHTWSVSITGGRPVLTR